MHPDRTRPRRVLSSLALAGLAVVAAACSSGTTGTATTTSPTATTATSAAPFTGATAQVTLTVPAANGGGAFATPHVLTVPAGWTAEVWARVPKARIEAWTPEGDLLVSVPSSGAVDELVPAADRAAPPAVHVLLSGLTEPQGLAFAKVDGQETLYVGESDQIDRYVWQSDGSVGSRTVVAAGLPDVDPTGDDVHRQKDVVVAADGTVYFNVGSSSNADPADRTSTPQRGTIMSLRPDGTALTTVATGVRNGEGLSIAPDGTLWSAVNERDQISYPTHGAFDGVADAFGQILQPYVNEHPPDEVARITRGRDLGWPLCNPDQDDSTPTGAMTSIPLVADAVTNPGGHALDCRSLTPIEAGLPAHSAPVGFHFLEGSALPASLRGGAVVAVHGSWDRHPPRAPAVLWMAWNGRSRTLEPAVTLMAGFQNPDGSRWGKAVDAVPGPDGALYVSDDTAGAVYRLVPPSAAG